MLTSSRGMAHSGLMLAVLAGVLAGSSFAQAQCGGNEPITWNDGQFDVTVLPAVVTSDSAGTHTTTPGVAAFGINHDGVGDLLIDNDSDAAYDSRCTASLLTLGGRRFALSAAHCVTDLSGNLNANSLRLEFELAGGSVYSYVSSSSQIYVHPNWNGSATAGYDVALLELDAAADVGVPSYLLNRAADEQDVQLVHVGYGNVGYGGTGQTSGTSGTKRAGLKEWDSQGLGASPYNVGGISNSHTMLTDDFDSGELANDGYNYFFGESADLGYGDDEVGVSQGDSGGPTFILDPADGIWKIGGVHSHGLRLAYPGGGSSDVDGSLNFSWGEFGVDTRVRQAEILDWIDNTIPEPATATLVFLGAAAALRRRRAA